MSNLNPSWIEFFDIMKRNNPNPRTELDFANSYTLLVAVVLSARCTDVQVNKVTPALFKVASTPQEIVDLGEKELLKYIKSIGLFRSKAKYIISAAKQIIEKHQGKVPGTMDELIALPGVGRKSANVILNTIYKEPTMPVDTHVFRVSNRVGLTNAKTVNQVEQELLNVIPYPYKIDAHNWLVLHGRYICKARKPACVKCDVSHLCRSYPEFA